MLCWTSSKMEDLCDSATASQLSQCILLTVFRPKFSVLNVRVMVGAFNQALKGAYSLIVKLRLKLYWTYSRTWTRDGSGAVPRPRHCEVSAQFAASGADMPRHQPSARHHHHCLCLCHCLLGTSPLSSPHIASQYSDRVPCPCHPSRYN